jgi:streptolysin S family bacteriocin protoxin
MKRLVTQFDVQRTRATAATPTCCCCCCCCVGSVLTATALATIDASDAARRAGVPRRWLYGLAAFLALPIALLAAGTGGFLAAQVAEQLAFIVSAGAFFGTWIGALVAIHGRLGSARLAKSISITVIGCTIMFGVEFFVGAALIFEGGGGGVAYLVLAAILPFVAVPLLWLWIRS